MGAGKSGGHLVPLLFLLALLGGYGTWNYQRNLEAEAAVPRPYKGYSDEQLDQLRAAYQSQVEALDQRYQAASGRRERPQDTQLLGEAVDEFQRVQRSGRALRELGARVSEDQASLQAIQQEQALRAQLGSGVMRFLRRAFLPPA